MRRVRLSSARLAVAVTLAASLPTSGAAQSPMDPDDLVHVDLVEDSVGARVDLRISAGWYVYAMSPGELGLPLAVSWHAEDGRRLEGTFPFTEPVPDTVRFEGTPIAIHRDGIALRTGRPPPDAVELRVRWAACRGDVCVPHQTVITRVGRPVSDARPVPSPDG